MYDNYQSTLCYYSQVHFILENDLGHRNNKLFVMCGFDCCKTLPHERLPQEMRELFIHSGYRPLGLSCRQSFKTIFTLHNETMNVWTHLLPAIYCIAMMINEFTREEGFDSRRLPIVGLIFACICVFVASSVAHAFCCMSVYHKTVLFMFDYCAIVQCGIWITCNYYVYLPDNLIYSSNKELHIFSAFFITVVGGVVCCWTMIVRPDWEAGSMVRVVSIAIPYAYSSIPALPLLWTDEFNDIDKNGTLFYHLANSLIAIILAGLMLASHLPERLFPGRFDVFGSSHQLFHVLVFLSLIEQLKFANGISHLKEDGFITLMTRSTTGAVLSVLCFVIFIISCLRKVEKKYDVDLKTQ